VANGKINLDDYDLSPEEREALTDSDDAELQEGGQDYSPEDIEGNQFENKDDAGAKKEEAGEEDDDDEKNGSEGESGDDAGAKDRKSAEADEKAHKGADDNASAAAADTGDDGKVADPDLAVDDDEADLHALPLMTPPPKADIDKAEADLAAAKEKFDEGDIDFAEYQKTYEQYLTLKNKAELVDEMNRQAVTRQWDADQARFLKLHPSVKGNEDLLEFFAGTVNKILQTPEGQKMAGMKVLSAAKARVEKGLGIKIPNIRDKAVVDAGDKGGKPDPKELVRKATDAANEKARSTVTLKDTPVAQDNQDSADRFAYLDRLTGAKYQAAVDRLSEADRRAYEDSH
jgi:hypothetical protein